MVWVYVLKSNQQQLRYVGITNDLRRRLREHSSGLTKCGQILSAFHLLHCETYADYHEARNREKFLKSGQGRKWLNSLYTRDNA